MFTTNKRVKKKARGMSANVSSFLPVSKMPRRLHVDYEIDNKYTQPGQMCIFIMPARCRREPKGQP